MHKERKDVLKFIERQFLRCLNRIKDFATFKEGTRLTCLMFNADSKSNSKKQNPILKNVQIWADEHVSILPLSYKSS